MLTVLLSLMIIAQAADSQYSWQQNHDCVELGRRLTDQEFIDKAIERTSIGNRTLRRAGASGPPDELIRPASVEEFKSEFPDCCSIYRGPPRDLVAPQGLVDGYANPIARVIRLKYNESIKSGDAITLRQKDIYIKLNSCGVIIDNG